MTDGQSLFKVQRSKDTASHVLNREVRKIYKRTFRCRPWKPCPLELLCRPKRVQIYLVKTFSCGMGKALKLLHEGGWERDTKASFNSKDFSFCRKEFDILCVHWTASPLSVPPLAASRFPPVMTNILCQASIHQRNLPALGTTCLPLPIQLLKFHGWPVGIFRSLQPRVFTTRYSPNF